MNIRQSTSGKLQKTPPGMAAREISVTIYPAIIMVIGLLGVLLAFIRFEKELTPEPISHLGPTHLAFFVLYVFCDLIRLRFLGEATISLGFPLILLTLLVYYPENFPLAALLTATLGSLISETLWSLIFSRRRLSRFAKVQRVFFYAGHHAVAGLGALIAYRLSYNPLPRWLVPDIIHIPATLVYTVTYTLLSMLFVWPHDRRIRLFLAPDQEPFVRVDLLSTLVLPIPLCLFYLYRLVGQTKGAIIVAGVLPLVFVLLFLQARRFTELEEKDERQRLHTQIKQRLGTPANMTEITELMLKSLEEMVDYRWGAVYSLSGEKLELRRYGAKLEEKPMVLFDPSDAERSNVSGRDKNTSQDHVTWPPQIEPGESILHQLASQEQRPHFFYHGYISDTSSDLVLPCQTALAVWPITPEPLAEEEKHPRLIGLFALARPKKPFTTRDWEQGQVLSVESHNALLGVQRLEKTVQDFYRKVEDFTDDPRKVQYAMQELAARGVQVDEILEDISESWLREDPRAVLESVAAGSAGRGIHTTEDSLREIYYRVREETSEAVMPPPDSNLIGLLQRITSSLSPAFGLYYQSQVLRQPAFKRYCGFLLAALNVTTIADILAQRPALERTIRDLKRLSLPERNKIDEQLERLRKTVSSLREAEDVEASFKLGYLNEALQSLELVKAAVRGELRGPERLVFFQIATSWQAVVNNALSVEQQRDTRLTITLSSNRILPLEEVTIQLKLENRGPGLVSETFVELLPSQDYQIQASGWIEVGPLPVGSTRELDFRIKPNCGRDALDLKFLIGYYDRARQVEEEFGARVHLRAGLESFTRIAKVYVAGPALKKGSSLFYGREKIFEFIRRNLAAPTATKHILLLIGTRRMGKTSILKQLPEKLENETYIHVFVDCQRVLGSGIGAFFWTLCDAISGGLEAANLAVKRLSPGDLRDEPQYVFEKEFMPQVRECIGDRRLLLAIDEFEALYELVEKKRLEPEIFSYLRSLMQSQEKMAFVIIGTPKTEELIAQYQSAFFNLATSRHVSFLEREHASQLIVEPVHQYGMVYDDLALDEILRLTACHPYFLQLVCDCLVDHCNEEQRNYVTIQDVRDVSDSIIERGRPHLFFVWQRSSPVEKAVLSALASLARSQERVTAINIFDHLQDRIGQLTDKVTFDPVVVTQALEQLTDRDIIQGNKTPGAPRFYAFTAHLYCEWVSKYKSLDRIVPELVNQDG